MRVVIPAAGAAKRFQEKGFREPKPLIEVKGKPLIQWATDSLPFVAPEDFLFLVREDHIREFAIDSRLRDLYSPRSVIVPVDRVTEGAACTVLLAERWIDNDEPLIIMNCDVAFRAPLGEAIARCRTGGMDGLLTTFESTSPRFSFARVDAVTGCVTEVAEKEPISNIATGGCYFVTRGADFVRGTKEMIRKNIRVNNEFYVAPVYNQLVARDCKIGIVPCEWLVSLGTPDEVEAFVEGRAGRVPV